MNNKNKSNISYWLTCTIKGEENCHNILCSFNFNLPVLSIDAENLCCSNFRHCSVQMLLNQTSCNWACLGALLQPLNIMVSEHLTMLNALTLTVVFSPMRRELTRTFHFFWCGCIQMWMWCWCEIPHTCLYVWCPHKVPGKEKRCPKTESARSWEQLKHCTGWEVA